MTRRIPLISRAQIATLNKAMQMHDYSLWFLIPAQNRLCKVPVTSYEEAVDYVNVMDATRVSGVRIARMDPVEGCESVLYTFY